MKPLSPAVRAFKDTLRRAPSPGRVDLQLCDASGVGTLTLRNAAARNALSPPMMAGLHDAVEALRGWDGGAAVVVTGEGGAFCAGADLSAARGGGALATPEAGALMSELVAATLAGLRDLPLVSVAAVDGHAVGGGAELAAATDWRCLGAGATLRFVHATMGVSPGWGGAGRLAALAGRPAALRLLLHAPAVGAAEAMRLGLADAVGAEGEPAADAARRLLLSPALATAAGRRTIRAIKRAVAGGDAAEAEAFASTWGGAENLAAIARNSKGRP